MACCSRRSPRNAAEGSERATRGWAKLARGALRLGRLRRIWGTLGNWLQIVKRRGRS